MPDDLIRRSDAKAAIEKMQIRQAELAHEKSGEPDVAELHMVAVAAFENAILALVSVPAADAPAGDGGSRIAREYAELTRLCRNLINQEWEQLNLDPIGEFIIELDANGFIADLTSRPDAVKE